MSEFLSRRNINYLIHRIRKLTNEDHPRPDFEGIIKKFATNWFYHLRDDIPYEDIRITNEKFIDYFIRNYSVNGRDYGVTFADRCARAERADIPSLAFATDNYDLNDFKDPMNKYTTYEILSDIELGGINVSEYMSPEDREFFSYAIFRGKHDKHKHRLHTIDDGLTNDHRFETDRNTIPYEPELMPDYYDNTEIPLRDRFELNDANSINMSGAYKHQYQYSSMAKKNMRNFHKNHGGFKKDKQCRDNNSYFSSVNDLGSSLAYDGLEKEIIPQLYGKDCETPELRNFRIGRSHDREFAEKVNCNSRYYPEIIPHLINDEASLDKYRPGSKKYRDQQMMLAIEKTINPLYVDPTSRSSSGIIGCKYKL